VQAALEAAGIEPRLENARPRARCGALFFDSPSPGLCAEISEASRLGQDCLLAVSLGAAPLSDSEYWRLLEAGAADAFAWTDGAQAAPKIAARFERWEAIEELTRSPSVSEHLVGENNAWRSVLRDIVEVARFTDSFVLITGESGTGKEGVARLIHALDPRPRKGELFVVDCAAVVPSLSGSEFFGHEKGAFTGAVAAREGAFAMADGGTLFLDEVGELPPPLQAELLRVIQEGMYKRVGSNVWRRTNFRLLCATNRSLLDPDSESLFRRDLYHRIAAWTCHLPTLRDRVDDIPILSRHFLRLASPGEEKMELDEPVARFLAERAYPGNVRDLKNLVFRIRSRHVGPGPITVGDIPPEERPCAAHEEGTWDEQGFEQCIRRALTRGVTLREIRNAAGEIAVRIAFAEEKGNLQQAARRLGITNRALQMRRAARREEVH